MVAVRCIEAHNVHACLAQLAEHLCTVCLWPDRGDDRAGQVSRKRVGQESVSMLRRQTQRASPYHRRLFKRAHHSRLAPVAIVDIERVLQRVQAGEPLELRLGDGLEEPVGRANVPLQPQSVSIPRSIFVWHAPLHPTIALPPPSASVTHMMDNAGQPVVNGKKSQMAERLRNVVDGSKGGPVPWPAHGWDQRPGFFSFCAAAGGQASGQGSFPDVGAGARGRKGFGLR